LSAEAPQGLLPLVIWLSAVISNSFEELSQAGGMLYWGIPSYRLPRNILDHEIDDIRALGVDIHLKHVSARILHLSNWKKDFDFIYLATGAHKSQKMGVPGEDMKNLYGGVEFLREFNANEDKWLKGEKTLGKKSCGHRRR